MSNYQVGKWYSDGKSVFKLRDTGRIEKVDGEFRQVLENEVYFQIQVAQNLNETYIASQYRASFLAKDIANMLNAQFTPQPDEESIDSFGTKLCACGRFTEVDEKGRFLPHKHIAGKNAGECCENSLKHAP